MAAASEENVSQNWNGTEWQDYCILLLQRRYSSGRNHSLQLVPDRHNGDLGIEAFSFDGAAYQCYAAQEPLSVNDCYEKQRDKLTTDLGKLKANETELVKMLGSTKIRRYVFMVHRHDSKFLVQHATTKATEVLSWGLSFIDPLFRVVVETDDDYAVERKLIHDIPTPLLETSVPSASEKGAWLTGNSNLKLRAFNKLQKIHTSEDTIEKVLDSLISSYLIGENTLDQLVSISPQMQRGVLSARAHKESLLVLEHPPGEIDRPSKLNEIANSFANSLDKDYPELGSMQTKTLAWGAIADWLMRCPLDFED